MDWHGTRQYSTLASLPEEGRLAPGTILQQRYHIEGVQGQGGMAVVYRARDLRFEKATRICAVKEMFISAPDPHLREASVQNFEREANVLASLSHPAVPSIFDYFTEGNRVYLVMEFVEGQDLEELVEPELQTDEEAHQAEGELEEFGIGFEPAAVEADQEEVPTLEETPEQVAAPADEWQPESQMEEQSSQQASEIPQQVDPESPQAILEAASKAADQGNLDEALKGFSTLIRKGKLVEEVIQEISQALRRHPINVQLWQTLGDAYLRIDDLQEALDAYTKAEELLR